MQVFAGNQLYIFIDASGVLLVEIDPPGRRPLDTVPVGILEPRPGSQGDILELGKIRLKSIEYRSREALYPFHLAPTSCVSEF
jgi:hypothetical protein